MKYCPSCKETLSLDHFSTRGKRGGLQGWCKACHVACTARARAKRQDYVNDIKRARGCKHCGRNEPAGLDFHHRDAESKEKAVGIFAASGPMHKLIKEIDKCDVLCAYCHRLVHAGLLGD